MDATSGRRCRWTVGTTGSGSRHTIMIVEAYNSVGPHPPPGSADDLRTQRLRRQLGAIRSDLDALTSDVEETIVLYRIIVNVVTILALLIVYIMICPC